MAEGRLKEGTTLGDDPRVPIPGSDSGSAEASSGVFQAVVKSYVTSPAEIEKECAEREVGLFIPGIKGALTVSNATGEEVDSKLLQLNRGEFYHYANNLSLPERDTYTLKTKLQPPAFLQYRTEGGKAGYSPNLSWWSSRT